MPATAHPGLGKTLSARTYAAADDWERWSLDRYRTGPAVLPGSLLASRTMLYTPYVNITARRLNLEIALPRHALGGDIDRGPRPRTATRRSRPATAGHATAAPNWSSSTRPTGSEPPAWNNSATSSTGATSASILIGMPGFDRQLARYPQLYSRIGFAHQYRPLDPEDIPTVLAHYWHQLGHALDPGDTDHVEAVSAVIRITGGNFRLIERLMTQVARVMDINQLDTISPDVVHAARQMLVGLTPFDGHAVMRLVPPVGGPRSVRG